MSLTPLARLQTTSGAGCVEGTGFSGTLLLFYYDYYYFLNYALIAGMHQQLPLPYWEGKCIGPGLIRGGVLHPARRPLFDE